MSDDQPTPPETEVESVPRSDTTPRLVNDLEAAGLTELAEKVRSGDYDSRNLAKDLHKAGRKDLAKRARDGEWDEGTPAV